MLCAGRSEASSHVDLEVVAALTDTLGGLSDDVQQMRLARELCTWCTTGRPWRLQCQALRALEGLPARPSGGGCAWVLCLCSSIVHCL